MFCDLSKNSLIFTPIEIPNLSEALGILSARGFIKFDSSGFLCVDIDDDYIHRIFPLIKIDHLGKPKYFDEKTNFIGAHISIIYPEENPATSPNITDTLCDFKIVNLFHARLEDKSYYALKIIAPELTNFRIKMGLSKQLTLKGCTVPLHVTVAVSETLL